MERKTFDLQVKGFDAEKGTFEGLLSVYDVLDDHGDVVERGAYTKTLQESGGKVPLLWQHDPAAPIGMLALNDGKDGLEASGELVLDDSVPLAKTAYTLLKAGVVRGLSIGYKAIKSKKEDNIRRLKEIRLFEGSLVTIPANRFATVTGFKALDGQHKDFSSELRRIQLWAMHYQMMTALTYALDELRWESEGSKEERIGAARAIIDQFSEAYLGYLPDALDEMGVKGAQFAPLPIIAKDVRAQLRELGTKFLALAEHSGTLAAAATEQPEEKIAEPDYLHSLREYTQPERWKS